LVVLNYYPVNNNVGNIAGYNIEEKVLGNIAQITQVIPPTIPDFVNFSPPESTQAF